MVEFFKTVDGRITEVSEFTEGSEIGKGAAVASLTRRKARVSIPRTSSFS